MRVLVFDVQTSATTFPAKGPGNCHQYEQYTDTHDAGAMSTSKRETKPTFSMGKPFEGRIDRSVEASETQSVIDCSFICHSFVRQQPNAPEQIDPGANRSDVHRNINTQVAVDIRYSVIDATCIDSEARWG